VEALWLRILGTLLIVLGLTLFLGPWVPYTKREPIAHTRYSATREKAVLVPRPVAALIAGFGVLALVLSGRSRQAHP
jgi:hypothetical protein